MYRHGNNITTQMKVNQKQLAVLKKLLLLSFKKIYKTHNTPNVTRASAQLISARCHPNRKFQTVFNLCILFKFNLNTFLNNKACQHSIFCLSAFSLQSDQSSDANFLLHVIHTIYIKHKALAFQLSALSSKWNKTLQKWITSIYRAP